MMIINGETKVYSIIGDPIKQVATPQLLNRLFFNKKENKVLIPMHVKQEDLQACIIGLKSLKNFNGAIITMPHKTSIIKLIDKLSNEAKLVGACNVIKRKENGELVGTNLDGEGFLKGLKSKGHSLKNKSVFLQGAGGASSAIAYSLCKEGIKNLNIYNRTNSKAQNLINRLKKYFPNTIIKQSKEITENIDILINATPIGMNENDNLLLDISNLKQNALVAETIINPQITCTLKKAKEQGNKIHKGIHMLENQLGLMIDFIDS